MLLYYLRAIIITALLTNSNHLEVQAKLCAVYPYLGITLFLCIARPSAQSELFICVYFQWQMDTKEHELFTVGFYIPLIRDQDISGDPKTRTTIRNTHAHNG
jgi:hypothetical protein